MDYDLQIKKLQEQILALQKQKKEAEFISLNGINQIDYENKVERLQNWCKEMILDHHKICLVDRIGNTLYYYSDNQNNERKLEPRTNFTNCEIFYKNWRFDKVYEDKDFKVLFIKANLKRSQREMINESINEMILHNKFVYVEF